MENVDKSTHVIHTTVQNLWITVEKVWKHTRKLCITLQKDVDYMKKWLLLLWILLLPITAMAADQLTLAAQPGEVQYQFSLKDKSFALLQYRTDTESGQTVIYAPDGQFSGTLPISYTPEGGRVTLKVLDTKQNQLMTGGVQLPADAGYKAPTGKGYARVTDFEVQSTLEGFRYRFRADGAEQMKVNGKTRTQSVTIAVTPDADGWFAGEVSMPMVYAYSTIQVSVLSANGKDQLAYQETIKDYAPIAPVEQAENGRLKGVTVCIDPGHQLKSQYVEEPMGPGLEGISKPVGGQAQGKGTSRLEHIVALEAAYVLRNELLRQGADVVMTRTEVDQFVSNIDRDNVANDANAHVMLRLHCDNVSEQNTYGISIIIPCNSAYAAALAPKDEYQRMGRLLLDDMRTACNIPIANHTGRVMLSDKYVGNNWARMFCFLVEMGYMSNPGEDLLMSTPAYQQLLAEGMSQGVYDIAVEQGWVKE